VIHVIFSVISEFWSIVDAMNRAAADRSGTTAAAITIGLLTGVVAGMLTGNLTLYIGVGLALGLALSGSGLFRRRHVADKPESPESTG
jgi:heme A synthase